MKQLLRNKQFKIKFVYFSIIKIRKDMFSIKETDLIIEGLFLLNENTKKLSNFGDEGKLKMERSKVVNNILETLQNEMDKSRVKTY